MSPLPSVSKSLRILDLKSYGNGGVARRGEGGEGGKQAWTTTTTKGTPTYVEEDRERDQHVDRDEDR